MKKKYRVCIIALMLSVVMFLQNFSSDVLCVFADWVSETFTSEERVEREFYNGNAVDKYNIGTAEAIQENTGNRTPTTKEYLMSDGTVMIKRFTEPVHYYADGEYKEIDNSLIEEEKNGESIFTNKSNSFKVSFDKTFKTDDPFIKIEENGAILELGYAKNDGDPKAETDKPEQPEELTAARTDMAKAEDGRFSYASAEADTGMVYAVNSGRLTGKIVVGKRQNDYTYTFTLQSLNLRYIQNDDGSINICAADGTPKFFMPVPYLSDANGNYSNSVSFELKEDDFGAEIVISADKTLLDAASFPVAITSEIKGAGNRNFSYANVYEDGKTVVNADAVYAGKKNGEIKSDLFMSFELPEVPSYYQLLGTSVNFRYSTRGMAGLNAKDLTYDVYVAQSTENLSEITYAEKPARVQNLCGITKKSEFIEKDLEYKSDVISPNNIIDNVLTVAVETTAGTSESAYFALNTAASTSVETVSWYQRVIGLEDEYSTEKFSIDGATFYVNNGTGYLTSVIDIASVNTLSDMPLEASLVYNDYYAEVLSDIQTESNISVPSAAGFNFKLNFQQFMLRRGNVYEMIDADGSISTFYACAAAGLYYSREKKLYYNSATCIAYDPTGNQLHFNSSGCLTKIVSENNPAEYISVEYTSAPSRNATTQTLSLGQISRVVYRADGVEKYAISFTYTAGNLTTVTTNADTNMPYTLKLHYDSDGNLEYIKNSTGSTTGVQTLSFGYAMKYGETVRDAVIENILNNKNELITFERYTSYGTVEEVSIAGAASITGETRCNSRAEFYRSGNFTRIYYFENDINTDEHSVSFNNSKEVISDWHRDSEGIVTVEATTNWRNISTSGTNNYVKEKCTYYHKASPSNDRLSNTYGELTYTINASALEADNHENYRFAIVFRLFSGPVDLLSGINLSVKIGNKEEENIVLSMGGITYVVIPCDYYSTDTNVVIKNNGTESVFVQYFNYTLINSERETYVYDSALKTHRLLSTTANFRSGDYSSTTYDDKQRVSASETRDLYTDEVGERTTYTYYDESSASSLAKGKIKKITTIGEDNALSEETTYTYTGSYSGYTEQVVSSKGSIKTKTSYSVTRGVNTSLITRTDENGISTKEYYKPLCGDIRLWKSEHANVIEEYSYNAFGQITNIELKNRSTGILMYTQTNNYNEYGVYTGSTYAGTKYAYGYEDTGYVTSIGYGDADGDTVTPMINYYYNDDGEGFGANKLNGKTYANGHTENYTYVRNGINDETENITKVEYRRSEADTTPEIYENTYDKNGQMTRQTYLEGNYSRLIYDYYNTMTNKIIKRGVTIQQLDFGANYTENYDVNTNRLTSSELFTSKGCSIRDFKGTTYTYDREGRLSEIECGAFDTEYTYDDTGKLSGRKAVRYSGNIQEEEYEYKKYTSGGIAYDTSLLTRINDKTAEDRDKTATYDANGYITGVSYNGIDYAYTYDNMGRLIKETKNGSESTYTYDSYNNIQKPGLTYTDGKLTAVNGSQIVYDALGNPTVYKGNAFGWTQGRKLASGTLNGNTFAYKYDGNGMRFKKTVNGTSTYSYYYGDRLLMESRGGKRIWYIYGVTGVEGILIESGYSASVCYLEKNTLGDIVAIRDNQGRAITVYEYDAWGNVTVKDEKGNIDTDMNSIGNINPFRYRGYYYDTETGFYYLQTRYYDPTICRFINADNYELISTLSQVPGQLNLYAYANNNPIMNTDETGEFAFTALLVCIIVGAIVGGAIGGAVAANNGETGWDMVNSISQGALYGSLAGALAGLFAGFLPPVGAFINTMVAAGGGAVAATAVGTAVAAGVAVAGIIGVGIVFSKTSRSSGKERSTDKPSWVNKGMLDYSKSASQNAKELLNNKYGIGKWQKGPGTEFNKIVKWLIRCLGFK